METIGDLINAIWENFLIPLWIWFTNIKLATIGKIIVFLFWFLIYTTLWLLGLLLVFLLVIICIGGPILIIFYFYEENLSFKKLIKKNKLFKLIKKLSDVDIVSTIFYGIVGIILFIVFIMLYAFILSLMPFENYIYNGYHNIISFIAAVIKGIAEDLG